MYVPTADLIPAVKAALKAVGYGRQDIRVEARESVVLSTLGGSGYRGFTILVNTLTGETKTIKGSWGGSNVFTPENPVDNDHTPYTLPAFGLAITGSYGGGEPTSATIYVSPSMWDRMLPAAPTCTAEELEALRIYRSYTSKYRADELYRSKITTDVVDGLVDRGYLKRNRAGAVSVTTAGKNAR